MHSLRRGFTLIELLIVVAIIAILAAIAVPNFLEAQMRSKVSKCKSHLRTYKVALESYRVDNNQYPIDWGGGYHAEARTFSMLTTPIAYMTSILDNPFPSKNRPHGYYDMGRPELFAYDGMSSRDGTTPVNTFWEPELVAAGIYYWMVSAGPNLLTEYNWGHFEIIAMDAGTGYMDLIYDATNGTQSAGDIMASSKRIY
ncbi:MAG TPA: prepilin-type N-terminal cleavage/methylation domain-containing protein [Sumerlaeia bacterium]|nr:prepilin-type N-terminal cleavage/methylation domain-containing protein [Sumerlaeia bacterium]